MAKGKRTSMIAPNDITTISLVLWFQMASGDLMKDAQKSSRMPLFVFDIMRPVHVKVN